MQITSDVSRKYSFTFYGFYIYVMHIYISQNYDARKWEIILANKVIYANFQICLCLVFFPELVSDGKHIN